MHCPPQGPRRPPRTSLDQTPRLDHICMASGVRTVTEHPGCPRPGCRSRGTGSVPAPPPGPIRFHPSAVALGEADGTELPPRGKGCFWAGVPWEPPRKGYSWLFYKYIYIFFVARYCYLTLGLGLRGLLASPNQAWARQPPWGARQCPGSPHPALGDPSCTSPAQALPVPVAASTAKLFTLFSDVIFKTSDIACLLGHCWQ